MKTLRTLLEYSYMKCKKLPLNTEQEDIYGKIIYLARIRIKNILRKHMGKIILKTIYLLKTTSISYTVEQIIGEFSNYKGSLWRIAMLHAVSSFIYSQTEIKRTQDIIDTCDMYIPYNDIKREEIMKKVLCLSEDPNIFEYINIYYSFGEFLLP